MKRTLALMLLLLLAVFALAACGDNGDTPPEPDTYYSISWFDENGSKIKTESVKEGSVPSLSYDPTDTAEWDYTFEGWSATSGGDALTAIPAANANASYYACVSAVKQKYTVTFNSNGGSSVQSQTVEYGEKATLPEEPTYENHKFMGWCVDEDGNTPVDFDKAITQNVEYFAIWNEIADVKAMLESLLKGYELDPFSYIPEAMRADFSANLVDADSIVDDYSSFVNISDISYGHGEQWRMVLDNLNQTKIFFNVLSVVNSLSTASITAFNNYFDQNPANTARHEFKNGIYNVTIDFDGEVLSYVLDYTATIPVLGEQTVQIALSMLAETGEKACRIQIGDANALAYRILEDSYEFAIKYLGVRRAMFSIGRDEDGNVSGHIFEYLTVSSAEVASAAEFYFSDDYATVVGNKADGLIGFAGYICELYDAEEGKMLGYEVNETLSAINYDTLWFNLSDIIGINSIKYVEATQGTSAKLYVNGLSSAWEAKKVGGIGLDMLSRRFDIEFRTQYVYSYDASTGEYTEHKVQVPMLFVQESHYDTLVADVRSTNGITIAQTLDNDQLDRLLADYDELVPVFIENKDTVTPEIIIAYIGEKFTFNEET